MSSVSTQSSFVLRLDSGQLLGSAARLQGNTGTHDAVLLAVEKAYLSGRLDQAQLTRTQELLNEMSRKVPAPAPRSVTPEVSAGRKRPAAEALQVLIAPPQCPVVGEVRACESLAGVAASPS